MNKAKLILIASSVSMLFSACSGLTAGQPGELDRTDQPSSLIFSVTNPSDFIRPDEFIRLRLSAVPADWQEDDLEDIQIIYRAGEEVIPVDSAVIETGLEVLPSGSLRNLELVFTDSLSALETRQYEIRFNDRRSSSPAPLKIETVHEGEMGDILRLQDGDQTFFIGHELEPLDIGYNAQLPRDLYVRMEGPQGTSKVMPLSHLYFNIYDFREEFLTPGDCQHFFILSPGLPTKIEQQSNSLIAHVRLEYGGWAQAFCPPYEQLMNPRRIDWLEAAVELTFYHGLTRVDTKTEFTLGRGVYNHNGFAMGGVETELARPRVIFGDGNHTVLQGALWADTAELTDRTEFMQIENDRFIFRRAATRDAGAPFETLGESDTFQGYYVVEGENGSGIFAYFPDFQRLALQNTRNEGSEVLPVNMIGAGPSVPVMVANPVIISQSHLGNIGDVWVPIAPGSYIYEIKADLSVPFDPTTPEVYDHLAERLAAPLEVALLTTGPTSTLSTATASAPPPSTSTPYPTAIPTPTPAPKSCDPPTRSAYAGSLATGSYLDKLARRVAPLQDGSLVVDNTDGDGWMGGETSFFTIPGPFSVHFSVDSEMDAALFYFSGRGLAANPTWWGDGIQNMYFSNDGVIFWDGRSESSNEWLPLRGPNEHIEYTIRFLEPCGKQFEILDEEGNPLGSVDITGLSSTKYPNGLFPDGIVSFGLQINPGGWMSMSELYVELE
jgi:hypothetical protein